MPGSTTDATLSGLTLRLKSDYYAVENADSAITLSPAFATATKSYTALVAEASVTVEPTSGHNATFAYAERGLGHGARRTPRTGVNDSAITLNPAFAPLRVTTTRTWRTT